MGLVNTMIMMTLI